MNNLVPNYDEDVSPESIDSVAEFFAQNGANDDKTLIAVSRSLDKECTRWIKFQGWKETDDSDELAEQEAEFLADNGYDSMRKIAEQFKLNWPFLIEADQI